MIQDIDTAGIDSERLVRDLWNEIPEKKSRYPHAVFRRHALFIAARKKGLTFKSIGRITGFNHATVMHAEKWHKPNLEQQPEYKRWFNAYSQMLLANTAEKELSYLIEELGYIVKRKEELEKEIEQRKAQLNKYLVN